MWGLLFLRGWVEIIERLRINNGNGFGKSTARGYNAPCFDGMVHSFATFVLMRWDTTDGKDRIALLSQKLSCSTLYHFFNHLQLFFR